MKIRIVFIDDEPAILRTLKRVLHQEPYDCSYFDNGSDALAYMEQHGPPEILVTDMLMPCMSGLEVLKTVQQKFPSTIRVTLSGFTDNKTINTALMGNLSHFFLHKPWINKDLLLFLSKVISLKEKLSFDGLQLRMVKQAPFPELPKLYLTAGSMVREGFSIDKIISTISKDHSISEKILEICNKAYCVENVGSLQEAVEIIGLDNILLIIIASDIVEQHAGRISRWRLWHHAVETNRIINHIYIKKHSCRMPINTGSIGLLHTIGLILLLSRYETEYERILNIKSEDPNIRLCEIEQRILNVNHMETAAYILNQWEIPIPYVEASLYYRDLSVFNGINREIVQTLHLGSYIAGRRIGLDIFNYPLQTDAAKSIGYDSQGIEDLINRGPVL